MKRKKKLRITTPRLLIFSFLSVIILGTLALLLPAATVPEEGISVLDSLFTATSAVCVTGLIVRDTGTFFTPLGRWIIFALFQAGGLGIMTFSTLFAVFLGRRIAFANADAVRRTLDQQNVIGIKKLLRRVIAITFIVEAIGASALFFRFRAVTDWSASAALESAVFHAVSAFCNAGFSLMKDSFSGFVSDPVVNIVMMTLIILGGAGFIVISDLIGRRRPFSKKRLSFQSRTVILVSTVLILAGAALFYFTSQRGSLAGMAWQNRIWASFFQSVTARTAGFNTVHIGGLAHSSLLVLIALMFIGASPGSTGGGIKTTTFAVILVSLYAMMTGKSRPALLGRSVPREVVREAFVIFFMALAWIFSITFLMSIFGEHGLAETLFEATSAFGTVGLSTGITPELSGTNKFLITLTMFIGRLGPLTIALSLALRKREGLVTYPEDNMMVG